MPLDTSHLDIYLGKKLKYLRNKMNWSLKTVAEQLHISIQQLQRYEQGNNKIHASMLYEIAKIFKTSMTSFFEGYEHLDDQLPENNNQYNILLIDDDQNDTFLFQKALSNFPSELSIYSIHDGGKALDFFRNLSTGQPQTLPRPDLIFLDLYLPYMKGMSLLKDIKARTSLQDIPVIVLTSSPNHDDIREAYHLKASGFIRKSFSYEDYKAQLYKTLNYWIDTVTLPTHY